MLRATVSSRSSLWDVWADERTDACDRTWAAVCATLGGSAMLSVDPPAGHSQHFIWRLFFSSVQWKQANIWYRLRSDGSRWGSSAVGLWSRQKSVYSHFYHIFWTPNSRVPQLIQRCYANVQRLLFLLRQLDRWLVIEMVGMMVSVWNRHKALWFFHFW